MNERAEQILAELIEGNRRFREGRSEHRAYPPDRIRDLADAPKPSAAVLACSDSRVSPEIIFDQELGVLFTSRVPGNVCSDSAKWMLELAVSVLQVSLVIVMGHTGCLAVKSVVDGQTNGSGGVLRNEVATAVLRARSKRPEDLMLESIRENARYAREQLMAESWNLKRAIAEGKTDIVASVYDVYSGEFELITDR